jgi:integrase
VGLGSCAGPWGGGADRKETFARADDQQDADGRDVLTFQQAIERAKEVHRAATAPAREEAQSGPALTVAQACARYVAHLLAENGQAAARDTLQRLRRHVAPEIEAPEKLVMQKARKPPEEHAKLGPRAVNSLSLQNVIDWRNAMVVHDDDPEIERRSRDTANRVVSMLKAALNLAIRDDSNGIVTDKAWRLLPVFEDVGRARHVHLDAAQVKRLINACEGGFRNLVIGLLLTGMRPGIEPRHIQVRHFSPETCTLHVPESKTGPRDVVLTKEGVEFFAGITAGRDPEEWMFLRADGSRWGEADHMRPMRAAVEKAKLPAETVTYSLRHTYASQSIMAGMNPQLLAENMGTSVRMLEQNYGKFFASVRRQMIEAAAPKLGLSINGNVVPLRSA